MATLKDVAKLAGTSPTTVSIIMNGKAKTRAISPVTVEKVMQAVRELNYQPSMSARMLRSPDAGTFAVGLFWSSDVRSRFMSRFLEGLERKAEIIRTKKIDLIIHPYKLNELEKEESLYRMNSFNAAIVANLSEKDNAFIHENISPIPLILLNRKSSVYHSVFIDDVKLGRSAAQHLHTCGVKTAGILSLPRSYVSQNNAAQGFIEECRKNGIQIQGKHIIESGLSIHDGAVSGEKLLACNDLPDAVFCVSDSVALGLLWTLNKRKVRVPEDIQVVTFGQGQPDFCLYNTPSITDFDIPFENMAARCIDIVSGLVDRSLEKTAHEEIDSVMYQGESTKLLQMDDYNKQI